MVASTELRAEGHVEPAILQLVVMARDEARKLLGSVAHGEDLGSGQTIVKAPHDDF